jgi:DHA1 family bicyclomycin/chloramphenicol resistance-like MFS transporter
MKNGTAPLWLLTLITFSGTLAMHIFVPALPEAARGLGASIGEMQLTMSVYIFGLASIPWPASPPAWSATCTT